VFAELFPFDLPARVNFVGGGGKTSLILRLASEYSASVQVLYTTTTRIHPPPLEPGRVLLTCDDRALLVKLLKRVARDCRSSVRTVVATAGVHSPGLLRGVDPAFGRALRPPLFPLILNEADGARSVSLKFPRAGEPVLMLGAKTLVAVIGLDCLMRPLGPATLFRWELAAPRLGLVAGEPLTPELAARVLLHPEGVCRDWKRGTRLVVFVNKVDRDSDLPLAQELARRVRESTRFPVDCVLWGSIEQDRAGVL
jgi:probable selenium-dependent hydroxylase accessory protein YqeC